MDRRVVIAFIAVTFISLTVGIIAGTELAAERELVARQLQLIAAIEQAVDRMRTDMNDMQQQISQWELKWQQATDEEHQIAESIIGGMLTDRSVAVVGMEQCMMVDRVASIISHAGGEIAHWLKVDADEHDQSVLTDALVTRDADVAIVVCNEGREQITDELILQLLTEGVPVIVVTEGICRIEHDVVTVSNINRGISGVFLCEILNQISEGSKRE